jgi:hypothetical protein
MNVSEIMNRVKRQFGDESGVQITNEDLIRWINDGQRQIVQTNESLLETSAKASTVADQQEYNLPTNLLILRTVMFKGSSERSYTKLEGFSWSDFNMQVDGWSENQDARSRPTIYTVYGDQILLYPIPDSSVTDAIKIYYNRLPVEVALDTDVPEIPTLYHEALVKYCLAQAYEVDEDFEAANLKAQELNVDIATLRGRSDWRVQESYPTMTVLPEDEDFGFFL